MKRHLHSKNCQPPVLKAGSSGIRKNILSENKKYYTKRYLFNNENINNFM